MLLDPQVNANALNWAADANKARTSTNIDVGRGSSLVRGVGPSGTYYNPRHAPDLDVKGLVVALERVIAELSAADTPERTEHRRWPLTMRQLRQEQIEGILRDYQAGATMRQIGEAYGLNRNAVSSVIHRAGVQVRLRGLTAEQVEEAVRMYRNGMSLARIGERLGVDAHTVRSRLLEKGVPMRDSQSRWR